MITVDAKDFAAAVKRAALACYRKPRAHLAQFARVRLISSPGRLRVSATDLDVFAEVTIEARGGLEGGDPFDVTADPKVLGELLRGERGDVEIGTGEGKLWINGVGIEAGPVDAWPATPVVSVGAVRDVAPVLEGIKRIAFAASTDETRPTLNSVLVASNGDLVAIDGRRLALERVDGGLGLAEPVIIPRAAALVLPRLFPAGERVARVGEARGMLALDAGTTRVVVRLVDATYPDYRQVIPPTEHDGLRCSAPLAGLLDAARRVERVEKAGAKAAADAYLANPPAGMTVAKVREQAADIRAFPAVRIEASQEHGDVTVIGHESKMALVVTGGEAQVGGSVMLIASYLREALEALDGDGRVEIDQREMLAPLRVRLVGSEGLQIIMPRRY